MHYEMMTHLAQSFPTLRGAPGVEPWDPEELDHWAAHSASSSAARHAVRFVLAVWHDGPHWQSGRFHLIEALRTWDNDHLGALRAWLRKPSLP